DTLKIDGDDYTVVGVLKSTGSAMGGYADGQVIIPISTAGYLGQSTEITNFYVRAETEKDTETVSNQIKDFLQNDKGLVDDDFEVTSQQQMLDSMKEMNRTLALLLGGIASISLLVGGIGVMNVMLVSVTERTREIGIRKSLGAKRKDIMFQFLVESMVLSLAGGIIGVLAGIAFGRIAVLIGGFFSPSILMILLSVGVSITVGLIFGIMPAYRAAKLRPVEALRYE
ncbi:MAG: FtsX-like permease family protein, partial [Firmicutes bacterium]|nr:FtsX-like permease family protein [Bacillota bacterium]